ncbi:MAG: acetyl-CoA carboxylase biotin carboxyl carrier protein [Xanthomonadaceae bacterium]|nr:acetyl-CoA carboxylase biotin carboxyl carrier protein [Xanthomonadaceae bacterium]
MEATLKKSINNKSKKSVKSKVKPAKKQSNAPWNYGQIEELLEFLRDHGVNKFEFQNKEHKISLEVYGGGSVTSSPILQKRVVEVAPQTPQVQEEDMRLKKITSPFVGTFYTAASPTSSPYVKDGQSVKKGDVLCIVEAMKLMNEIESEISGKVRSVLAENGQPVEYGQPLFLVEV